MCLLMFFKQDHKDQTSWLPWETGRCLNLNLSIYPPRPPGSKREQNYSQPEGTEYVEDRIP